MPHARGFVSIVVIAVLLEASSAPAQGPQFVRDARRVPVHDGDTVRYLTLEPDMLSVPSDDGLAPLGPGRVTIKMVITRQTFDDWLFGLGSSAASGRDRLERELRGHLAVNASVHGLAEADREKLRLAGRGDIKRFFDRARAERLGFEEARKDNRTGMMALLRLEPLGREFKQGPFGEGSLFAKVLAKVLADREASGRAGP